MSRFFGFGLGFTGFRVLGCKKVKKLFWVYLVFSACRVEGPFKGGMGVMKRYIGFCGGMYGLTWKLHGN